MSIGRIRQTLVQGSTTHADLVRRALDAASAPAARAVFTRLYAQEAIACALAADQRRVAGLPLGALAGLPVSIKDMFDVAGETTESASPSCAENPPAKRDAVAVQRLRAAGAAIVGKTNMSELAFTGIGINPSHGTPTNPVDTSVPRVAGGSSSGAAVSVALGLAVAGLGSDTGGSIRIPAALCAWSGSNARRLGCPGPVRWSCRERWTPSAHWPQVWRTAWLWMP